MSFHHAFLDAVVSWPHMIAVITASHVWAASQLEVVFIDESCTHFGKMTNHNGFTALQRTTSVNTQGDLRVRVGALSLGQSPRPSQSSFMSG